MARPNKQAERRRMIIDAAGTVAISSGVGGMTLRAVAAAANMEPTAVLYYFDGIADIVRELVLATSERFFEVISEAVAKAETPHDKLVAAIEAGTTGGLAGNESRILYEFWTTIVRDPSLVDADHILARKQVSAYSSIIEEGAAAGVFRPRMNPRDIASSLVGLEDGLVMSLLAGAKTREEVVALICSVASAMLDVVIAPRQPVSSPARSTFTGANEPVAKQPGMPDFKTIAMGEREADGVTEPVVLANWTQPPQNRYAFTRFSEFFPTASIPRRLPDSVLVSNALSSVTDLGQRLEESCSDALYVDRGGRTIGQWYRPGIRSTDTHLLMSVSKSLCGLVVGTLIDDGLVDPGSRVDEYVSELSESAFGDATVQQLLDMTATVNCPAGYDAMDLDAQRYRRAAGWAPPEHGDDPDMYHFLRSLRRNEPHGAKFAYHSAHTDALAWLCETVTEKRYPAVLSERLWSRIGAVDDARIGVDRGGFAFANAAVNCTPRDLARVGRMMLNGGSLDGEQIVSASFVAATLAGGDRGKGEEARWGTRFPNGSYRNQWWSTGNDRGNVYALGIHGQYIWLDPPSDTVIVKFSSQPDPLDGLLSANETSLFADIARAIG